jgi:DNA modification methylase
MEDKEPEHDFGTKLGVKRNERIHTPTKNNHPTVKPIALMEYLIKLVSREGSIVLDHFAGSGTTLIACAKLNRRFIGIEKEEEYIKIAKARLKPYLEQKKLIFNDNSQSKLKEEIQLNTRANPHDAIKSYEDLF